MIVLEIITQLFLIILVIALMVLILTAVLPWQITINEINTDKKFKGMLWIWAGIIRISLGYPLSSGWKRRLFKKLKAQVQYPLDNPDETPDEKHNHAWDVWLNVFNARQRISRKTWRFIWQSLHFEPWTGTLTIGFENPAYTGIIMGNVNAVIASRNWSGLYTEADFVNQHSQFIGKAPVKIYPLRIIFLAVNYAFESLKLFWIKNFTRGRNP